MNLAHYNGGKRKLQSHEISINEEEFYNHKVGVFSHNPFDITGYGETKEEALQDFKKKFDYIIKELIAFETLLFGTDVIENNIIKVDYFRNTIK